MTALIYKDFVASKHTYLLMFAIGIVLAGWGLYEGYFIFIPALLVYFPTILNMTSFGTDSTCDFTQFAFTTPIARRDYVLSKYILPLISALLSFGVTLLYLGMKDGNWHAAILMAAIAFAAPLLFSGIQLPALFKFGEHKGRLISLITFIVLFTLPNLIGSHLNGYGNLPLKLASINTVLLSALLILISLILIAVSVYTSLHIVKRKEY